MYSHISFPAQRTQSRKRLSIGGNVFPNRNNKLEYLYAFSCSGAQGVIDVCPDYLGQEIAESRCQGTWVHVVEVVDEEVDEPEVDAEAQPKDHHDKEVDQHSSLSQVCHRCRRLLLVQL